jgi:hypothetical protein
VLEEQGVWDYQQQEAQQDSTTKTESKAKS